jgi:hypothetical protein
VNHIAIGRALSPGGELLPPHHRRQQGWWRWRWSQWRRQRWRWRPIEMALGVLPYPGRVPEQRLMSPKIHRRQRQSCGTLSGNLPIVLGFSIGRLLIGKGASSEVDQGGLTMGGCGQGLGRAPLWCGQPLAPLWLPFGTCPPSGKNRSFQTCFVQFREYFWCSFSETQK